jgi:hypothetical protein
MRKAGRVEEVAVEEIRRDESGFTVAKRLAAEKPVY